MYKGSDITVGITTCHPSPQLVQTIKSIRKSQKISHFQIIVISDRTPVSKTIKQQLKKLKVTLIENKTPDSVPAKQKQILKLTNQSKFLILTQDDILFKPDTLFRIINEFHQHPSTTFVGVQNKPQTTKSQIDNAINIGTLLNNEIGKHWNHGDNYLATLGRVMAFKTSWFKKLTIPNNVISLDAYIYLENKKHGGKYTCLWDAEIEFKNPENIKEQLRKSSRFQNSQHEMASYKRFSNLQTEYQIPFPIIIKASLKIFLQHPISFCLYTMVYLYTRILKQNPEQCLTPLWEVDLSTKQLNPV